MLDTRKPLRAQILRWAQRTPVHTFVMCPLLVIAGELALNRGKLTGMPWGAPLLAWGYLQYLLVGNYPVASRRRDSRHGCNASADHRGRPISLHA
jgi:hypothetical protein